MFLGIEITTWHSMFTWVGITAAFFSSFSFLGTWWTGKIIDDSKILQIEKLQRTVANIRPIIFSYNLVKLNVYDNGLYKQVYEVSINSPSTNIVFLTNLKSEANKVKGPVISPTETHGVRQQNQGIVPFQNFILTFWTDKTINEKTDSVRFSTK